MNASRTAIRLVLMFVALAALPGPDAAATVAPAQKCLASKLGAAGEDGAGRLLCESRGLVPVPVSIPCCTGVCNVPGPEAGPNVMAFCTEPPDTPCPCWTTASLDAAFPPGYFEVDRRGGAVCSTTDPVHLSSTASCTVAQGGSTFNFPASGAGVVSNTVCVLVLDADGNHDGHCDNVQAPIPIDAAQTAACKAALLASQAWARECD